ncbi:hypothetical protein KDW_41760 [Dictyobacter vulcani]|uniref:Uncharacterized protein n=1 Tax=Dictyobacter vulcani TaxID=2607529 RepID=A0A5J4KKT4_9CHLR|nr:glycoside hydrolase family 64 protein [Dictyobacter vulcani]GER90014.1 hypothetical protein KDW_41760 [Dictyobacter vulcani]
MENKDVHAMKQQTGRPRRRAGILTISACLLVLCTSLALVFLESAHEVYADTSNFSQGSSSISSNQALFWFQPTGWSAGYVILHYMQPGNAQQNVNMTNNSSTARWEYTAGSMSAGQVITYSFTYQQNGAQYDTGTYTLTFGTSGGGVTPTPTVGSTPTPIPTVGGGGGAGTFPLILQNMTHGAWANNQIYVMILSQTSPGQWFYLKADGTQAHINHLDANAPNHLTKNGVNYANMAFTLDQASTVTLPTLLLSARMYLSIGSPLYIPIATDDSGWGGPNITNSSDPNTDVYFDWYELTYQYGVTPFGGNTTQVDQFGFPFTARVQQTSSGFDQTNGITLSRSQVFSQYASAVSPAFQGLANTYRILAPHWSPTFASGGSQANYMQAYIDQTWNYYSSNQFTLTRPGETFSGKVINGQLQFTHNGVGSFVLNKPTTADVLACSGTLASPGMTTEELALGAEFCAAFNRGVAQNVADWSNPAAYYTGSIKNDYAMFWHQVSLNNKAYGFPYDDVDSQSPVAILPNANPPSSLTIGIGW